MVDWPLQVAVSSGFTVVAGSWDGPASIQFGSAILGDTHSINCTFAATGPVEVSGNVIHVYIGHGRTVSTAGDPSVLLRMATDTAFPSEVSVVAASQTVSLHDSKSFVFVMGNNALANSGQMVLLYAPETSSALQTVVGMITFLRRWR